MQEALLDGVPVPYHQEAQSNGVRTIWDSNSFVSRGEHTYTITYRTRHQIAFWDKTDELYWNVTGNGWTFPIESAEVRVQLRSLLIRASLNSMVTGPQGLTERASESWRDANGDVVFPHHVVALRPRRQFTVSAIFPKGHITRPDITR